jgi:hypothetical protein
MDRGFSRDGFITVVLALVLAGAAGCKRQDARLQEHHEKLQSLGATTVAIGNAWLAGNTSGTYTSTALEQTFVLLEKERSALASEPEAVLDPGGADLSQTAERLSRLLALMMQDVRSADPASLRQRLTKIPFASPDQQ